MSLRKSPNVIIFGPTDAGKSSLINMLADRKVAKVAKCNDVGTVTLTTESYELRAPAKGNVTSLPYVFWDTPGISQDDNSALPPAGAYEKLVDQVELQGVNLVLYCIRAGRFTRAVHANHIFWKIICGPQVPVVLVLTGLEQEANMDDGWDRYKKGFDGLGMKFDDHACVTTIKGRKDMYADEYQHSQKKVWQKVQKYCAPQAWYMTHQLDKVKEAIIQYITPSPPADIPDNSKSPVMQSDYRHNIIIFGETGCGKSSLVNMIVGDNVARVSNGPVGCTFANHAYDATIGNTHFRIYDTAGLNEQDNGRAPHWTAVRELYTLIRTLDDVSLLIYCLRGRIKQNCWVNWILFNKVICAEQVPVVLVVTGLEHEDDWESDERIETIRKGFKKCNINPTDIASIVAIKGQRGVYTEHYQRSQTKLRNIIERRRLTTPWGTAKDEWFASIYRTTYTTGVCFSARTKVEFNNRMRVVIDKFVRETSMTRDESEKLKETLVKAEKKVLKSKIKGIRK